jgi:hypothetical protein
MIATLVILYNAEILGNFSSILIQRLCVLHLNFCVKVKRTGSEFCKGGTFVLHNVDMFEERLSSLLRQIRSDGLI